MKITMYELLGMVKRGNTPKIKFNNSIYEYHGKEYGYCRYYQNNTYISLDTDYCLFNILNDEVEILEEEPYVEICGKWFTKSEYSEFVKSQEEKKIPEKLNLDKDELRNVEIPRILDYFIESKINEIIGYLKRKGDE